MIDTGLTQEQWEGMVVMARERLLELGTVQACRFAMYSFRVQFPSEEAEYRLLLALNHACNDPRPYPEYIPRMADLPPAPNPSAAPISRMQTPQVPVVVLHSNMQALRDAAYTRQMERRNQIRMARPVSPVEQVKQPSKAERDIIAAGVRAIRQALAEHNETKWKDKPVRATIEDIARVARRVNGQRL